MQEGARGSVFSLSSSLPVVAATAIEALLENNVPVPYLFMCDRARRQSAVGKR